MNKIQLENFINTIHKDEKWKTKFNFQEHVIENAWQCFYKRFIGWMNHYNSWIEKSGI